MNPNPRITLTMTQMDAVVAMVDGNPGAISVLSQLINSDPMGFFDVLHLDDAKVYGSDIWVGFKDVCGEDIKAFREKARDRTLKPAIDAANAKYAAPLPLEGDV